MVEQAPCCSRYLSRTSPYPSSAVSFPNMLINKHPYLKPGQPSASSELNFHLRHFHVETSSAHAYLADAPHDRSQAKGLASVPLSIITSPVRTTRPTSLLDFQAARKVSQRGQSALLNWQEDEVSGPDVTRRETLLLLAKVTSKLRAL